MKNWNAASDAVNPAVIPRRRLRSGAMIPAIGMGTFGSDHVEHSVVAKAVKTAAKIGYRHFDCASVYGNERFIGESLAELQDEGLDRNELWITSKLWNDKHNEVFASCEQSLRDLRLDYLDLFLIHWPFPNHHSQGCDVDERNEAARPYIHADYMKTWRDMERLVGKGLVRHIGTSNMSISKLRLLLRDAEIRPEVNEMELHPHFQQPEFIEFLRSEEIQPIAFSPIGSPQRPERDRTLDDSSPTEDPVIVRIAKRLNAHPAVICIKWAVQQGQIPIPFSVKRSNLLANLHGLTTERLTDEEMAEISSIDRRCRLIKGQVFLWKENQNWEDLWDLNGEITPL
jgi:diketogulonate reductase-like aldo/keto reductase